MGEGGGTVEPVRMSKIESIGTVEFRTRNIEC